METAKQLCPGMEGTDLVRVAVGLIQARAKEASHYSGKFAVGEFKNEVLAIRRRLNTDTDGALSIIFSDRHQKLEKYATAWATKWLADQEEKPVIQ